MASFHAIICALTWSIAVILFKKSAQNVDSMALNAFKNTFACALMAITTYFYEGTLFHPITTEHLEIIVISGLLGIGIADALFLRGLQLLGASRVAIIDCLYSPFIITLSILFLGEQLLPLQITGSTLIIGSVVIASLPALTRKPVSGERIPLKGVLISVFAILALAIGITIIKPVLADKSLFWVATLRLFAGSVSSLVILAFSPKPLQRWQTLVSSDRRPMLILASFMATYVSTLFWLSGFKLGNASIASVLNQTSTLFTVVLAALVLKEKLTRRKILACILAISGAALIHF